MGKRNIVNMKQAVKNFAIKRSLEKTRFITPFGDTSNARFLQADQCSEELPILCHYCNPISPYIFNFKSDKIIGGYLSVKLSALNYAKTISSIEDRWKEFTANAPPQYYFVDADF